MVALSIAILVFILIIAVLAVVFLCLSLSLYKNMMKASLIYNLAKMKYRDERREK